MEPTAAREVFRKSWKPGLAGVCLALVLSTGGIAAEDKQQQVKTVNPRELYTQYCAVCHGASLKGDGPMASSLKVKPADLTRISLRNGGMYPEDRVERIISGEKELLAGHGTRTMPVWGPVFGQIEWDRDMGKIRTHNLAVWLGRQQTP